MLDGRRGMAEIGMLAVPVVVLQRVQNEKRRP
jgi:hypothetical protein